MKPGYIGIDIGGSHISAARIGINQGEITVADEVGASVDTTLEADLILSSWTDLIKKINPSAADFLGIAMPGPFDYQNGISLLEDQGKMKSLFGRSVRDGLSQRLSIPSKQIRFTNDAEAFLLGEKLAGAGKHHQKILGLTLGTGLGSAFFLENRCTDAKLWTAPFREGIAEDYLGTAWFISEAEKQFDLKISGVKDLVSTGELTQEASYLFSEFGKTLGEFMVPYFREYGFDQVILGGKISLASPYFLPFTLQYLSNHGFYPDFKSAQLGEKAALIGACWPLIHTL